ncbi:hypothetical protein GCM10011512_06580 [Tersicoccus solisilvae]|uniref:AbiEi antitoxin C-terminal domain-containing protein n=1 Tax=Tersicoccus solisilvae TaxID=1882339 RepID=A0ABQ1NR38_9MICC|nr:hypothetical protein [Tersicoccus solisilvae]GGC82532.1 hypothetical protein GCM10011512_06580 [Tersicoccus solisilvae]
MTTVPVLRPGRPFRAEELTILTRDGILRHVIRDVYTAVGMPETIALRAVALDALLDPVLRRRALVCRSTAAWLYAGGAPPPVLDVLLDARRRSKRAPPGLRVHETVCSGVEAAVVAGVLTTTLPQTVLDLAQYGGAEDEPALEAARRAMSPQDREHLAEVLATMPRRPGRHRALERLGGLVPR